jgi:hypothetical protein
MVSAAFSQDTSAKARIHVYRPKAKIVGVAIHPSIYCDGIELYRIHPGTFFDADITPGKHMISAGRCEVGQLLDLEPGKDYYFRFGHKSMWATAVSMFNPSHLRSCPKTKRYHK